MKYRSTRGSPKSYSFSDAVLLGLAEDGGLLIPHHIPALPADWHTAWLHDSFTSLAFRLFSLYIPPSEISPTDLKTLIARSYEPFRTSTISPLIKIKDQFYILELFHGPTFAFKDVALQFLGNLFEYLLEKKNKERSDGAKERITVLGATSGDTGSAAIHGLRGKTNISIFILHPRGRVSPVQEAQMTTVLDKNVHNLAVEGTFDDCQDTVKALFTDLPFNEKHHLGAVNSINWARILAQTVYYFHSYFQLMQSLNIATDSAEASNVHLQYVVPTGNFGDVLAGYYAKRMGLPIESLVVATNSNDILDRFYKTGRYERISINETIPDVKETLSPAMDIAISSNFERWLWYLAYEGLEGEFGHETEEEKVNRASAQVRKWMQDLKTNNSIIVAEQLHKIALRDFQSARITDEETLDTIARYYSPESKDQTSYVLDPHTAVGVTAAERQTQQSITHQICLATAHPAKFSNAVETALEGSPSFNFQSILPPEFKGLLEKERNVVHVERAEPSLIKEVIERELQKELL